MSKPPSLSLLPQLVILEIRQELSFDFWLVGAVLLSLGSGGEGQRTKQGTNGWPKQQVRVVPLPMSGSGEGSTLWWEQLDNAGKGRERTI